MLSTNGSWLGCVSGACYKGEETRRESCISPLFTQYQIENNVECLCTFVWKFDFNILLFVCVGNETFAHWRQLPGSPDLPTVPLLAGQSRIFTRCPASRYIMEMPRFLLDFSQKYQMVPRMNRRAAVYFGTQLISGGCILLKKISLWALPTRTVPLFAGKSRFFARNVPLKTLSRLAGM